ncbi:MAG: TetR family transcriptional regulator C-terminal domain-containing protein [Bifidobacteriaceae bacterium]|jgi:AcrR family transcriptional regulator|nr:TetR family transcriptional regulator C-terminal domain-containing protein [Bifidobacteriaceae bacterium]
MPKAVDRERRIAEAIDATWALVVAGGLGAVTLRSVAARLGYANGALKPYFRSKSDLLKAAYIHAFESTTARATARIGDSSGLVALRRLCLEIMPLDKERRTESRVVMAFWEQAAGAPELARVFRDHTRQWGTLMAGYVAQARAAGEITTAAEDQAIVDQMLWAMMGLQSMTWLVPDLTTRRRQVAALDAFLAALEPDKG